MNQGQIFVDALFFAIEAKYPPLSWALELVNQLIDKYIASLPPFDPAAAKLWVDSAIDEVATKHPYFRLALELVKGIVNAEIDALLANPTPALKRALVKV